MGLVHVIYSLFFSCRLCRVSALLLFFSRRRRHTWCLSDWSSDVCSSDLLSRSRFLRMRSLRQRTLRRSPRPTGGQRSSGDRQTKALEDLGARQRGERGARHAQLGSAYATRSEERRVGNERSTMRAASRST